MSARVGAMEPQEAFDRLRSARVGRIATVTPEGRPHVVPFVFAIVESERVIAYWAVDDKPKRSPRLQRLRNLERAPAVAFVVDGYDEDWDLLWWVRATGTGRVVEADEERAVALTALAVKYPQYAEALPRGPVVAIDVDEVVGWSAARAAPEA